MQSAETVRGILRQRGQRGLPLQRLSRQLFNPALYLKAYRKISRNAGATTPGVTPETVDGMARAKIQALITALRQERYRWKPVRRTFIAKKNSAKKRPLGLPTWSDKLLQEVIRLLLEAYYEPQFSDHSHGFRPRRGCHTALQAIAQQWKGTVWFIEGDISRCFDSLDHELLLSILREKIPDNRFLRLVANLLRAGYLEDWRYYPTDSGTPQGGIASPLLANLYRDRLDQYVETRLLPTPNRGKRRAGSPPYERLISRAWKRERKGDQAAAKERRRQAQHLPSKILEDPDFRRLRYVRYADAFLLSDVGPRGEAEAIKRQLGEFLDQELQLALSSEKTLITHARTEAARFLGYEITTPHNDPKQSRPPGHRRCVNGDVGRRVPQEVIRRQCQRYQQQGKPTDRQERTPDSAYSIVAGYQQEYRGGVEYYRLAANLRAFGSLQWVMGQSLAKTLAHQFQCRVNALWKRYGATLQTPHGPRAGLKVVVERDAGKKPLVACWGGISLRREGKAVLQDRAPPIQNNQGTELVQRLLADTCELCGSQEKVEVHHLRALKDLKRRGRSEKPAWMKRMAARQRKTLVVCRKCHDDIHAGRLQRHRDEG